MTAPDRTLLDMLRRIYEQRVDHTIDTLRRSADRIEREKIREEITVSGTPPFSAHAQRVIHTLVWDVANASADSLVDAAAQADMAWLAEHPEARS